MSEALRNRVQQYRAGRGWSQEELARRTGLSRAAVSAIEINRVAPSTAAALTLAAVFGCRVEDLFALGRATRNGAQPAWAWVPTTEPRRFWHATVGEHILRYPIERTFVGATPCDGVERSGADETHPCGDPERTLVIAGCDPAVGLLAALLARDAEVRVVPFIRSSRRALDLLRSGLVHVAGLHLEDEQNPGGNEAAVRERLGPGHTLLRVARWQEGVALAPGLNLRTVRAVVTANVRWVGREPGSGARRCLDAILKDHHPLPKGYHHVASDHVGVVETIRTGWAQAGICVQVAAAEAGLDFMPAHQEAYDLCYRSDLESDPRVRALVRAVRSRAFRHSVGELPGYDPRDAGATVAIHA